jgi:hypothetical protein
MPRRTQIFSQFPWTGGINTSIDPALIPSNDLQAAENVLFSSTGARLKREGFDYFDDNSDIPAVTHRSSSGTTRTLVFAATLTNGTVDKLVSGEGIIVTTTAAGNEANYYTINPVNITAISTTTVTDDTITYTAVGSLAEGSTATSTLTVKRKYAIRKLVDYWRANGSNIMTQVLVAITEQPKIFQYDSSGNRKEITIDGTATARVGTANKVSALVFNNRLIIAMSRTGNTPIRWNPEDDVNWLNLNGSPPDFSICAQHLSRVWANDKSNRDRLHYSSTGSAEEWQGVGDSGAIDIRPGDGDPEGITAIFPFKGQLFVAKKTKIYRVVGNSPENFTVLDVSNGLGIDSHNSIAQVDNEDVMYVSIKGIHSIATTDTYGDFTSSFISSKIQPTFNEEFNRGIIDECHGVYIPTLNSVAFSFAEQGSSTSNNIWLYNIQIKEWYKWTNVSCTAMAAYTISDTPYLFLGTSDGKVIRTQNGTYLDYGTSAIPYRIKTGAIYVDQNPMSIKMFKRINLFFKPTGAYNFTLRVKIDGFQEQILGFSQTGTGDLLDSTFILGQSILGFTGIFSPSAQPIDGMGHGITVEVEHSGAEEQVAIYGFAIEYDAADIAQETVTS